MTRRIRPSSVATRAQTRALADHVPDVVETLLAQTPKPSTQRATAAVAVLMGLPGTGKTHCARLLAERLGAAHVASDELRSRLFVAASYTDDENAALFRIVDGLVDRLLDLGHRVIVDATHLSSRSRASLAALAERRAIPITYVLVEADEGDVLARLAGRRAARAAHDRSDADEAVYRRMRERGFEPPGEHLTIRSGPDVDRQIAAAATEIGARWSGA